MRRRLRVLHIINNLAIGGAELMLARLARSLAAEFDQQVLCILDEGKLAPILREAGIPVLSMNAPRRMPNPVIVARLAGSIRRLSPDIVQTWLYQSDLLGGLAARIAGVRQVVWNIRASDLSERELPLLTRLSVRICASTSRVIPKSIVVCAESAARLHSQLGYDSRRMVLIHNGVDTKYFAPDPHAGPQLRRELGITDDAFVVGHFGRLHAQKDHETFFDAVSRLRKIHPGVQVVVAGEQMDRSSPEVSNWLSQFGLRDGVHLLGARSDMPRLYPAVDVAASSSAWGEGFPNVLAEAMSCGVPCVATDCGDSAVIIGDAGLVVQPRQPELLADALNHFVCMSPDDRRRLSGLARSRIIEKFSMEHSSAQYAALYRSMRPTEERS